MVGLGCVDIGSMRGAGGIFEVERFLLELGGLGGCGEWGLEFRGIGRWI